ncbi:MAG: hypothetical protein Q7R73_05065 [bacterium]|nr:hypothetical protein [bacterium]
MREHAQKFSSFPELAASRKKTGEQDLESELRKNNSLRALADFYGEISKRESWEIDSLQALGRHLGARYPNAREECSVFSGILQSLYLQRVVDKKRKEKHLDYNSEIKKNFAEYNYLISHFFIGLPQSPQSASYGKHFWKAFSGMSERLGLGKELNLLRAGVMGQVAVYKALRVIGEKPELSLPREDVSEKIDLWNAKKESDAGVFQIKTSAAQQTSVILEESEWLDFPSVKTKSSPISERHFVEKSFGKMNAFSVAVKEYGRVLGKNIKAWYISLPTRAIDYATGEVSADVLEELRRKIKALPKSE